MAVARGEREPLGDELVDAAPLEEWYALEAPAGAAPPAAGAADGRAVGATVDLCERAGKPLVFVVNAATPKARITTDATIALSQHGTVAPVTIHQRVDFAASMIDGRTVMEIDPAGRSASEIADLWSYVSDRLEKNFRRTVFAAPNQAPGIGAARLHGAGFGRRVVG